MKTMSPAHAVYSLLLGVSAVFLLSACSSNSYKEPEQSESSTTSSSFRDPAPTYTPDPWESPEPDPSPDPDPSPEPSESPEPELTEIYTRTLEGEGYTSTEIEVSAARSIQVRVRPLLPNKNVTVNGRTYSANYSGLLTYVKIESLEMATPFMSSGLKKAQTTSGIMDFSSAISGSCDDLSCARNIKIRFSRINTDVRYLIWRQAQLYPWERQPAGYPWKIFVEVATDLTEALTAN